MTRVRSQRHSKKKIILVPLAPSSLHTINESVHTVYLYVSYDSHSNYLLYPKQH